MGNKIAYRLDMRAAEKWFPDWIQVDRGELDAIDERNVFADRIDESHDLY